MMAKAPQWQNLQADILEEFADGASLASRMTDFSEVPRIVYDYKAYRAARKRKGLCAACKRPADAGVTLCALHRAKYKERKRRTQAALRALHRRLGLCVQCGRQRAQGVSLCEMHRLKQRQADQRFRQDPLKWKATLERQRQWWRANAELISSRRRKEAQDPLKWKAMLERKRQRKLARNTKGRIA